jgi:type II secretory pathway pseudopilin PulG
MRKHLLTVFMTVVFVGLPAMLIVPNVLNARNRGRQKRTMADMRTLGTAYEAYATDRNSYDVDAFHGPNAATVTQFEAMHRVRLADLERALAPKYIRKLPKKDGWGREFELRTGDYDDKGHARAYAFRSYGSDGIVERDPYDERATFSPDNDLVYSNGNFIRYPEAT